MLLLTGFYFSFNLRTNCPWKLVLAVSFSSMRCQSMICDLRLSVPKDTGVQGNLVFYVAAGWLGAAQWSIGSSTSLKWPWSADSTLQLLCDLHGC
jgi:hypothetical protein